MVKRLFVSLMVMVVSFSALHAKTNEMNGTVLKVEVRTRKAEFSQGVIPKNLSVEFHVENISALKVDFWVMDCSFEDQWSTDNEIVVVNKTHECDKNVPVLKSLKPGESYDGVLSLGIRGTSLGGQIKFRLNFSPLKGNLTREILNTF